MADPPDEETASNGTLRGLLAALGPRTGRRADPRASVALAGAGCALAVLGILIASGDVGSGDSSFNQFPGTILTALAVAAGAITLRNAPSGPLATAGTVAVALGVPSMFFFMTFQEGSFPPYSTEGILVLSTMVWGAAYATGPARGRPLLLGAALVGAWATVLQVTEKVFDSPFLIFDLFTLRVLTPAPGWYAYAPNRGVIVGPDGSRFGGLESQPVPLIGEGPVGGLPSFPDPMTVGLLSLGIGFVYLGVSRRLDHQGHHGVATPLVVAALPALAVGVFAITADVDPAGAGLLAVAIGAGLAIHGASVGRRATTWIGAAASGVGLAVVAADIADGDAVLLGPLFLLAGICLVLAAHAYAVGTREPDEIAPAPGSPDS